MSLWFLVLAVAFVASASGDEGHSTILGNIPLRSLEYGTSGWSNYWMQKKNLNNNIDNEDVFLVMNAKYVGPEKDLEVRITANHREGKPFTVYVKGDISLVSQIAESQDVTVAYSDVLTNEQPESKPYLLLNRKQIMSDIKNPQRKWVTFDNYQTENVIQVKQTITL